MDQRTVKEQLAHFGRSFALLMNRAMMYQKTHPMIQDSIADVHRTAEMVLFSVSPLVFILNREQFYIDEEPLDPRLNVKRTVGLFKTAGIQSLSFEKGLTKGEIGIFVDTFAKLGQNFTADMAKKEITAKGAYRIKINHVVYKKVTEDDQVVSREALKKVTPMMEAEDQESRKKFMETLLESVLAEEFADTLNITSLLKNPSVVSQNMIQADLAGAARVGAGAGGPAGAPAGDGGPGDPGGSGGAGVASGAGGAAASAGGVAAVAGGGAGSPGAATQAAGAAGSPGVQAGAGGDGQGGSGPATAQVGDTPTAAQGGAIPAAARGGGHGTLLLHQLEIMQQEVKKHLRGEGDVDLSELAQAIFEMKKQLLEGLQTQKALGIAYANEATIVENANALADQVLIQLIKEEYQAGAITTQRLAMIITRLIPSADELKRLLPEIKKALLEEGMPVKDYLMLIHELKTELQNDALARVLQESSETIGVDSENLIEEVKRNPAEAAELIYLASEIRKGSSNEAALSDILVDYVERLSGQMVLDNTDADGDSDGSHLKKVMADVESSILKQLGRMNVETDVLSRMEKRLNERMDTVLDKVRAEWLNAQTERKGEEPVRTLSVLQTLEHNVGEDEDLGGILQKVREKVEAGTIDANDFSRIHAEINRLKDVGGGEIMHPDVLKSDELMFVLEKEIAKSKRYSAPFSVVALSFVRAKPKMKSLEHLVTIEAVLEAAMETLVSTFREVDYIGQIGKNKVLVILPMIDRERARLALERVLRLLHGKPLMVKDIPVQIRVAGVATGFDAERFKDAGSFARHVSTQLMDMVSRVKNIQVLF